MTSNSDLPPAVNDNEEPPRRATELSPARIASILTAVLLQVQVAGQGGTHDPAPLFVALVLVLTAVARPDRRLELPTRGGPARPELRAQGCAGPRREVRIRVRPTPHRRGT